MTRADKSGDHICDYCGKALGPYFFQKESKSWQSTGRFCTFQFCSEKCADLWPRILKRRTK